MTCTVHRFDSLRRGTRCCACGVSVPKLIDVKTIADSIGWDHRKVRRVLVTAGLVDRVGRKWYTTKARLLSIYPEMAAFL